MPSLASRLSLPNTLAAWGSEAFAVILGRELTAAEGLQPLLLRAMTHGNQLATTPVNLLLLHAADEGSCLRLRLDVLFQSVVAGCSCADDPTPWSEINECCHIEIVIDKTTAQADMELIE